MSSQSPIPSRCWAVAAAVARSATTRPTKPTKVTFDRDVSGCAYIATAGAANDVPARTAPQGNHTGPAYVQPHWQPDFQGGVSKDPTAVLVTVRSLTPSNLDGFHLAVFC